MLEKLKAEWQKWGQITPHNALYDRTLIWLFLGFLVIGFVMVTSASIPVSTRLYNDPFHFAVRDGVYVIASLCVCGFFVQIPSKYWEKNYFWLLAISVVLLLLTLFIGKEVNGAVRWISIGSINFQSSEFAKLAIICYFASFYTRKFSEMRDRKLSFFRPMLILILFGFILYRQKDLGSTALIFILTFAMLFIMGARILQFIVVAILGAFVALVFIISVDYRIKRILTFIDPFADAYGEGYQLSNSQMAFGQGELFGRGLGNSVQKLEYLPEAHTDFVMAVVGEEFGLVGICVIVVLLLALTFRALKISREALIIEERFKGFFAFGIGVWIFVQGFVNLGVASGLLPTKGLTFPLVSYGGSSLVIMAIAIAVLLRIDHESRLEKVGHAHLKEDE